MVSYPTTTVCETTISVFICQEENRAPKKEAAKELNSARVQEVKTHEYQDSGYAEEAAAIG
jgi:hypothetical protein